MSNIESVPHDRLMNMGRNAVLTKCPLIIGCPFIRVSLEDRFYCIRFVKTCVKLCNRY